MQDSGCGRSAFERGTKWVLALCVCVLFGRSPCAHAADSPSTGTAATGTVTVISSSGLASNLVLRIEENIRSSLRVATRSKCGALATNLPLDSVIGAVAKLLEPADVIGLALVSVPNDDKMEKIVLKGNIVVLDIEALKPNRLDTAADTERFYRRVEKESMRALGGLLGLTSCPNPTCALYRQLNEADLDQKGCNFCPPCSVKAMDILARRGVQSIE